jgi:hypothetical protein
MKNNPYYYYYSFQDFIFSTKLNLFISKKEKFTQGQFHLPNIEKKFDEINITEEPKDDLQNLYKQRAVEIRNNYDYVTLFYSGGPDSHCILESFLLNNIFIDEIVIFDIYNTNEKYNISSKNHEMFLYLDAEGRGDDIEKSALPLAKYFVETYSPHTKITYFPKIQETHLDFWTKINKNNFAKELKTNVSELLLNRPIFRIQNTNVFNSQWKSIKKNKKVVHLWGREKPAINYDDIGFYFFFNDQLFSSTFDNYFNLTIDQLPNHHEYFFIYPSTIAINLFLKQCHILINKLPKYFFEKLEYKNNKNNKKILDTRAYQDKISDLIYDFKIKIPYKGLKPEDLFLDHIKNPNKYPNLNKMINFMGRDGIKWPTLNTFFMNNNNLDAYTNYKMFRSFVYNEFFINDFDDCEIMMQQFTNQITTKKFYIKYFNA